MPHPRDQKEVEQEGGELLDHFFGRGGNIKHSGTLLHRLVREYNPEYCHEDTGVPRKNAIVGEITEQIQQQGGKLYHKSTDKSNRDEWVELNLQSKKDQENVVKKIKQKLRDFKRADPGARKSPASFASSTSGKSAASALKSPPPPKKQKVYNEASTPEQEVKTPPRKKANVGFVSEARVPRSSSESISPVLVRPRPFTRRMLGDEASPGFAENKRSPSASDGDALERQASNFSELAAMASTIQPPSFRFQSSTFSAFGEDTATMAAKLGDDDDSSSDDGSSDDSVQQKEPASSSEEETTAHLKLRVEQLQLLLQQSDQQLQQSKSHNEELEQQNHKLKQGKEALLKHLDELEPLLGRLRRIQRENLTALLSLKGTSVAKV